MPRIAEAAAAPDGARDDATGTRYEVEAVARAARALAAFGPGQSGLTLTELSRHTGVPKATLLGILNTLAAHDLVRLETGAGDATDRPTERYALGYAWLRYGDLRRTQINLRESALPLMRQMRDALNETVILSLRVGDRRVHLDYVESTQPVRRVTQLGLEGPLHVGAAGLVLLGGLGDAEIEAYLSRELGTAAAAAEKDSVRQAVAAIRRDGYAVISGTVNVHTSAVAAPVRNYAGDAIASLTVSCPRDRFSKPLRDACIAQVTDGAARLSRRLGYGA